MNEVTVNMDNLTVDERMQLLALVEKGNKKPFEVWKPTKGSVWVVQGNGRTSEGGAHGMTLDYYAQGRAFETREQAEFYAEQERILTQYKRLAEESWAGEKIDWNNRLQYKFSIVRCENVLRAYENQKHCGQGKIYFRTRESLENAMKTIGGENIIKYLFWEV
jgi:hypothetical protein